MTYYEMALAKLACFVVTAVSAGVCAASLTVLVRRVAYLRGPRGHRGLLGHKGPVGPAGRCACRAPRALEPEATRRG